MAKKLAFCRLLVNAVIGDVLQVMSFSERDAHLKWTPGLWRLVKQPQQLTTNRMIELFDSHSHPWGRDGDKTDPL
jgi:hypothetical protein